jgi:hypothetical protein
MRIIQVRVFCLRRTYLYEPGIVLVVFRTIVQAILSEKLIWQPLKATGDPYKLVSAFSHFAVCGTDRAIRWINWVRVRVTLRLAGYRQSARFGAKPLETHDQRFIFSRTFVVIVLMQHPLWRGDGLVSYEYAWLCQVYVPHMLHVIENTYFSTIYKNLF